MYTSERIILCPKCNGQKIVSTPPWLPGDVYTFTSSGTEMYTCPVCNGIGYVVLVNEHPEKG